MKTYEVIHILKSIRTAGPEVQKLPNEELKNEKTFWILSHLPHNHQKNKKLNKNVFL